jgi:hypothetical protein
VSDSLQRLVDERDRASTEKKALDRIPRQRVSRRICGACWHMCLDKRFTPGLQTCPMCGGKLHEVLL